MQQHVHCHVGDLALDSPLQLSYAWLRTEYVREGEWLLSFFYSWVNPWHLLQFTLASDGTKWGLDQPGLARTQPCSGHSPFSPAIVYLSGGAKAGCFLEPLCWLCTIQRRSWHRGNSLVAIATGFKTLLYPQSGVKRP